MINIITASKNWIFLNLCTHASGLRVLERSNRTEHSVMACPGALLAFQIIVGLFPKRRLFSVTKSGPQNRLMLVGVKKSFFLAASLMNTERDILRIQIQYFSLCKSL